MELSILIEPVEVNEVILSRAKKSLALVKENEAMKRKITVLEVREKWRREIKKRYHVKNRDKIAASHCEYRQRDKETLAAKHREYQQKNKERVLKYKREYHQRKKEKANENQREILQKQTASQLMQELCESVDEMLWEEQQVDEILKELDEQQAQDEILEEILDMEEEQAVDKMLGEILNMDEEQLDFTFDFDFDFDFWWDIDEAFFIL